MHKKIFLSLVALSGLIADEPCDITVLPERLTARHIEANGIGYNQGYSTIEGFFTHPDWINDAFVPFLDLRGHIFNDGKPAANAGVGLRYLDSMVWGLNAYYDYRKTEHQNYNQVSLGFEALGEVWDFRLNGYFPVGRTKSHFYHPKFHEFKQHHMIISVKKEFAMTGTNAEAGYHFHAGQHIDLYAAAGPYYFAGDGKHAIGGQGRLYGTIWDYVGLEVKGSYDTVFKGIVQGEISFIIPFSGKKHVKKREGMSCSRDKALRKRAYQRVDRQEIIVLDHKREHRVAINPHTDEPWFFWFVENTSHSLGTFESPFPTLVQAQNASSINDVIYVFPGDGTTTGMSTGISLQNNQKLFGSGIKQLLKTTNGKVHIPAQSSSSPLLTNTVGAGNVVTLASGNEVSGVNVMASVASSKLIFSGGGAHGASIHNNILFGSVAFDGINIFGSGAVFINNNQLTTTAAAPGQAIRITTDPGTFISGITSGNTMRGFNNCIGMNVNNGGTSDYEISGNTIIDNIGGGIGIFWGGSVGLSGANTGRILNNRLIGMDNLGIQIVSTGDAQCIHIEGNQIMGLPANSGDGIQILSLATSFAPLRVIVLNNIIDHPGAASFGVNASTTGTSSLCLELEHNTVTNGSGYHFANAAGTINLAPFKKNVGNVTTSGTITSVKRHTCDCDED